MSINLIAENGLVIVKSEYVVCAKEHISFELLIKTVVTTSAKYWEELVTHFVAYVYLNSINIR